MLNISPLYGPASLSFNFIQSSASAFPISTMTLPLIPPILSTCGWNNARSFIFSKAFGLSEFKLVSPNEEGLHLETSNKPFKSNLCIPRQSKCFRIQAEYWLCVQKPSRTQGLTAPFTNVLRT